MEHSHIKKTKIEERRERDKKNKRVNPGNPMPKQYKFQKQRNKQDKIINKIIKEHSPKLRYQIERVH